MVFQALGGTWEMEASGSEGGVPQSTPPESFPRKVVPDPLTQTLSRHSSHAQGWGSWNPLKA